MTRSFLPSSRLAPASAVLATLALVSPAAAQAPPGVPPGPVQASPAGPAPPGHVPPLSVFLQQRVPEELAVEGIVLSRQSLRLEIEQIGDKLLISVIDGHTGRVAASTKLDTIPPDREAAVATVTHVVSELVQQTLGAKREAPPAHDIEAALARERERQRAEREQRERAELQFRREAIRFGTDYTFAAAGTSIGGVAMVTGGAGDEWKIVRGELDQELSPREFYTVLERPDLLERLERRRRIKYGFYAATGLAAIGSIAFPALAIHATDRGRNAVPYGVGAAVSLVAFTIALPVAFWLDHRPHPISENEAKVLASEYNERLRQRLGLPTALPATSARAPRIQDLKLAPYVSGSEGGLALTGRF